MNNEIKNELIDRVVEVANLITTYCPVCAPDAAKLKDAARVNSPVLYQRAKLLIDKFINNTDMLDVPVQDKNLLGGLLIDLDDMRQGRESKVRVIRLRVTSAEYFSIQQAAGEAGQTISQYVRDRIFD